MTETPESLRERIVQLERRISLKGGAEGDVLVRRTGRPFGASWEGGGIAARVYNSGALSVLTNSSTALTFDSERYDTDNIHSVVSATGRLTCVTPGKYFIHGHITWATNADVDDRCVLFIQLNGATNIASVTLPRAAIMATRAMDQSIGTIYDLAVGDYVELVAYQNSGSTLTVSAVSNNSPEFGMARIGAAGGTGASASGIDHGGLTGLGDDDHLLYLLATGSRAGSTGVAQSFGATGIATDVIAESTAAAGVTVDGVLLKDNLIAASAVPDTHGVTPSAHHAQAHAILDSTPHSDTLTGTVVDGDIIIGNVTPKWSRLPISIPAVNVRNVLGIDNGELRPSWKTALDSTLPVDVAGTSVAGTSLVFSHRDHIHKGVATFSQAGQPALYGDIELDEGNYISIVQTGQTIVVHMDVHDLLASDAHGDVGTGTGLALGSLIYGNSTPTWTALAGNITTTKKFLTQTGDGAVSAAPAWGTIADGDVPATHSGSAHHAQAHVILDSAAHSDTLTGTVVAGDIIYGNATPKWARLPKGTAAQVLTMNAGATAPEWATPAAGGGAVATDVIWDAKGDLAVGTGADTAVKLTAGANGATLQALSTEATGLIWRAIPWHSAIADAAGTTRITLAATSPNVLLENNVKIVGSWASGSLGINSAPSATSELNISPTLSGSALNWTGIRMVPIVSSTKTLGLALVGMQCNPSLYPINGVTNGAITGLALQGTVSTGLGSQMVTDGDTATMANMIGVSSVMTASNAVTDGKTITLNITDYRCFKGFLQVVYTDAGGTAAGSITNAYVYYAQASGSAKIINWYGLYIENESAATTIIHPIHQVGPNGINYFGSATQYKPTTVQTIAAGTAILANATIVQIQSTGNVTVTAAPTIADGQDGQILTIINIDSADTITIQDQGTLASSNLRLMTTTVALSPRDSIKLTYNSSIGDWVQTGPLCTVI